MSKMQRTILAFPFWSSNPYLNMLYLACQTAGWHVTGVTKLEALVEAVQNELHEGDIVHVHWTAPVTEGAMTYSEAEQGLAVFKGVLDTMADKRIELLWTVHNEIAHDTAFYEVERDLARTLASNARLIVQLHELTAQAVARSYQLPADKLVTLRHVSYLGLYPDSVDDTEARERLGIRPGAPTVGFVGRVRQYKGIETLFAAVDRVASRVDGLTLLLAGKTSQEDLTAIEPSLPRTVEIVRRASFVPDEELGLWLRASNVLVLPYRRILNSGSIMLAATFGTPCIIPDDTPLAELYQDQSWVRVYETRGDQVRNLAEAIIPVVQGDRRAQQAARRFARSYTPFDMSRDYLRILDDLAPVLTRNGGNRR
jgi:beta-1,4-mannosyltransferase